MIRQEQKENASKYPALYGELNRGARNAGFDENKINQLYSMAIKGRTAGIIPIDQWEMFATDLVTYYYDKIIATSEETKTTVYKRLLDCVKNDYDNVSVLLKYEYAKKV